MTNRDAHRPEEAAEPPAPRRVFLRPEPEETKEEFKARLLAMTESLRNPDATDDGERRR
jgi:hypothetical protein